MSYCKKINSYITFKLLGKGAYSNVWLAYDIKNSEFVAVKVINHEDKETAEREIRFNRKLQSSKNISIMKHYFVDKENSYMVFKLYGGSFYELYKYNVLSEKVLNRLHEKALQKVLELHNRFKYIHGDLKPESFMYYGENPICKDFIDKFNKLGGVKKYLDQCNGNWSEALTLLEKDLFEDEDYNSDLFSTYNSSNESECSSESCSESGSDSESDGGSESENESESGSESETSSNCSIRSIIFDYTLTEEQLENLEFDLIDYSHVHKPEESEFFEPTRYYRCLETLKKKEVSYKKDYWALGLTFYEMENRKVFVDPQGDNKDAEQIKFIKENYHLIEKWLEKSGISKKK